MQKKRYTITFNPKLKSIDDELNRIKKLGVEVQSEQRFIGTAIVNADDLQLERVCDTDSIAVISETSTFHAM